MSDSQNVFNLNHNINLVNKFDTRKYININVCINSINKIDEVIMSIFDRYIYLLVETEYDYAHNILTPRPKEVNLFLDLTIRRHVHFINRNTYWAHKQDESKYCNISICTSSTDLLGEQTLSSNVDMFFYNLFKVNYHCNRMNDSNKEQSEQNARYKIIDGIRDEYKDQLVIN